MDLPDTVLPDVHRIAGGVGATVALLSDLSNGNSRIAYPIGVMVGRRPRSSVKIRLGHGRFGTGEAARPAGSVIAADSHSGQPLKYLDNGRAIFFVEPGSAAHLVDLLA